MDTRGYAPKPLHVIGTFALGWAIMAAGSYAHADELRIRSGASVSVYSGELTSLTPHRDDPNELRFTADSVTTYALRPIPVAPRRPLNVQTWTVFLQLDDQSAVLTCAGNVPAFTGNQFAFDVECAP